MTQHTHAFSHWPFGDPIATLSYCTAGVADRSLPVRMVAHDVDGDWQFLDGTNDEPGEPVLLCLGCVFEADSSLADISDLPRGWRAWRDEPGDAWERWEAARDEDESGEEDDCCIDKEAAERKALADIAEYGLHVLSVREGPDSPPFTYSIGIQQSLGMPELIMVGLKSNVAHAAINECYRQMKEDGGIAPGARVKDLLGGDFECLVIEVAPEHHKPYLGWALWLNKGLDFRAWQIVYPSTANVYPWEPEASDGFRKVQPLLGARP